MAQPCREAKPPDEGQQWLRRLTEAVVGWGRGELDRPLPTTHDVPGLATELVELGIGLELTRRALRAEQANSRTRTLRDPLTGVPNREHFTGLVQRMVARLARHGGTSSLLLLDVDNFRPVNNDLGPEAGDQLLVAVAELVAATVRTEDAVARLGGDEFGVLLEGTGPAGAERLAQRLLAGVAEPFTVNGQEVTLTASIGVTSVDPATTDASEVIRRGEVALYVAKRTGKARATTFEPAMDDASRGRLRLEADLRQAPHRGELRLHYQPVFDLATNEVVGVEALLRWQHPARGLLAPGAFVGMAEETGLIVPVGEWVLEAAAAEQSRLRAELGRSIPVQVNVSARQLRDPDFVSSVAAVLDRYGVPPGGLGIEITESVVLEETDLTIDLLGRLRDLGAFVLIDDFGVGYSSLTYLRRFPIDVLKLDRSFIEPIAVEAEARAVVQAVIRLGHDLGLSVVAEGVGHEDQLRWLRDWGCDAAQGFLLARPMPPAELDAFLAGTFSPV
ncbi:MAG: putative bifunctional diguanylate cyclase/phosphodiesterase [Acidimicrobiia bacterium]